MEFLHNHGSVCKDNAVNCLIFEAMVRGLEGPGDAADITRSMKKLTQKVKDVYKVVNNMCEHQKDFHNIKVEEGTSGNWARKNEERRRRDYGNHNGRRDYEDDNSSWRRRQPLGRNVGGGRWSFPDHWRNRKWDNIRKTSGRNYGIQRRRDLKMGHQHRRQNPFWQGYNAWRPGSFEAGRRHDFRTQNEAGRRYDGRRTQNQDIGTIEFEREREIVSRIAKCRREAEKGAGQVGKEVVGEMAAVGGMGSEAEEQATIRYCGVDEVVDVKVGGLDR